MQVIAQIWRSPHGLQGHIVIAEEEPRLFGLAATGMVIGLYSTFVQLSLLSRTTSYFSLLWNRQPYVLDDSEGLQGLTKSQTAPQPVLIIAIHRRTNKCNLKWLPLEVICYD